ncbi:glycosyltransferase, partial [Azoarcus sp. L1K30]|uniref:glycosyltransferase n=1 Tax=Azoarcus sp. L1K30 TaxID=2820277 RepID=UPI001B838B1D
SLWFVGDGPARAGREAAGAGGRGLLFAGMRVGEDLAAHYASADLFLFPSVTETFGNVTTEALASGLPVIGFDYAAAAERVAIGENGWLAPLGDEEAFVDAVVRVGSDDTLRRALAAKARASVVDADWGAIARQLVAVIEDVVQAHEARTGAAANMAGASG